MKKRTTVIKETIKLIDAEIQLLWLMQQNYEIIKMELEKELRKEV